MYIPEMSDVLSKAMKYNLKNIHTYKGYNGADLLKLEFHDNEEMLVIRDYARKQGLEAVTKTTTNIELFCIYEQNDDVYSLKY